jgi:putative component of membrane protein insertase Oxa1/YidC/SpoIIIJ protein YidD
MAILCAWSILSLGQSNDLNSTIATIAVRDFHFQPKVKRKWINWAEASRAQKINPFWYLSGALLYTYQNVLSEQIQADCNYQLSCSGYTKRCIEQKGLIAGILLGADQLNACQPNAYLDYESDSVNGQGKIINDVPN